MVVEEPGFLERTRRRLTRTGDAALKRFQRHSPELPERDAKRLGDSIDRSVDPTTGEMVARAEAEEIGARYRTLDETGRRNFFELLANSFGRDEAEVEKALARRAELTAASNPGIEPDIDELLSSERELRRALVAPREDLFRRFNGLDDGVKFVVDLRDDLREFRKGDGYPPQFRAMDAELRDLLSSWFDVGNLELRRISWDTPASLLEKLIAYEAVHEITSWNDLKNRLEDDRRCYGFFHPGMPDEPLIFVEVALVKGLAGNLIELLDTESPTGSPDEADTAIFYSISNCQPGLAGVNLGNLLIKQVVSALLAELPHLKMFSTLSPIPGLRSWLEERTDNLPAPVAAALADATWVDDPVRVEALKEPLLELAARYLLTAKRGQQAQDRVANFHLSNGSRVERINWLANPTPIGLERSMGIMVNYRYVPEDIPRNHHLYVADGEISVHSGVRALIDEL